MDIENYTKMWKKRYYELNDDVGENLKEAKEHSLKYYKAICKKHGNMLLYTKHQYCPVCAKGKRDERHKKDRIFNRARGIYNEVKRRAKNNNIGFDMSLDDMRKIYGKVNKCPVFGIKIDYSGGILNDNSPSVDRLDPEIGYYINNINIISNRANRLKNNGTAIEHLQLALWMFTKSDHSKDDIEKIIKDMLGKL